MPIFALNLPESLFRSVRELIDRGLYQSLEGFLEVAAYNQLALERGVKPEDLLARDLRQPKGAKPAPPESPDQNVRGNEGKRRKPRKKHRRKKIGKSAANSKEGSAAESEAAISADVVLGRWVTPSPDRLPEPVKATGLPAGEHLWGQVTRLFPLKLACRWIMKSAVKGEWPRYLTLADELADEAAAVGQVLNQWDAAAGRRRDEILSTGLPRRGNSASRDRFVSQYLARVTRGGDIQPGAVCLYALAASDGDAVALTAEGVKLASLQNPILDRHDAISAATLTEEESAFLYSQIHDHAPGEYGDMKAVLTAVRDGRVTPTAVAEAVRGVFPTDWSEVVFRTHLSGLVGRLTDLRLLRRQWEGRNVQYVVGVTEQVEAFLT